MRNDVITVLDIGSSKVAAAAIRVLDDGALEIAAAASTDSKGIRRGVVIDVAAASDAVDVALKRVHQSAGIDIQGVIIGIGGPHVHGVNSQGYLPLFPRGRTITREDVLQVINHSRQVGAPAASEQVQAFPREFIIDGRGGVSAPIGMTGGRLEVLTHIVSAESVYLQNLDRAVGKAGKRVSQMVLRSLASGLAVLSPDEMDKGVAVVDIGGGTSEVAIFVEGSVVFSGSVPVGGQLVTSDVSKLLKTSPDEAERLKLHHGAALADLTLDEEAVDVLQLGQTHARPMQRRVLCEIVEARMRELALMVRQVLGKSALFGKLPGGLVLTGGASKLTGTAALFEEVMPEHKVRFGEPRVSGPKAELVNIPSMAAVVGLALYVARSDDDELSPASGPGDWKDRISTFWSLVSGRA